jgi:uncharacterized protein (TIGR03435 family)
MRAIRIALAAGALTLSAVDATSGGGRQAAFDVASVKPNRARVRTSMTITPGGIIYTNVSLSDCLQAAYGVKRFQISGPEWLRSERYDIDARTGGAASAGQSTAMLQELLRDRFKLSLHREKKELPVFALLAGKSGPKNGPKLRPGDPNGKARREPAPGGLAFVNASMVDLADFLSGLPALARPVFDSTGLPGGSTSRSDWAVSGATAAAVIRRSSSAPRS